jgi:putative membrane protein
MDEPRREGETQAVAAPPVDSRLRLGLEITLLAWVRTGLALMGFGFVLARFGLFLLELDQGVHASERQIRLSFVSGIVLIGLGVFLNLAAAGMHYPYLIRTRRGETDLPATWWLGLILSVILAAMGVGMAVFLLIVGT